MKNRAKCKLCSSIVESFHFTDYVICKCGEIGVSEGISMKCYAKNYDNFLRVDDEGNEIQVKTISKKEEKIEMESPLLSKKDRIDMLDSMIKNFESLPQHVMTSPVNHYDLYSFMLLTLDILKSECKE